MIYIKLYTYPLYTHTHKHRRYVRAVAPFDKGMRELPNFAAAGLSSRHHTENVPVILFII